ncbi:MAG: phosphatidylglycerophosphatase A [Desulfovibrionaceae bacterium]|nr:phosphatidylglycerophosphatase A [Desulfovibrionaceae bacterium]
MAWKDRLLLAVCRVEPAGLSPWAPGTMGSIVAIILAPFIFLPLPLPWKILCLVLLFVFGSLACSRAEKLLAKKDPGEVVLDEVLGQWLTILPYSDLLWWELGLALIFFRFFDILKPCPIRASEDWLPGGFGVMLDDVLAGLYAMILLVLIKNFF